MERTEFGWQSKFTVKRLTEAEFDPKVPRAVGAPPYRPRKMVVRDSSNDESIRRIEQATKEWLAGAK